jgi:two-component system, OmpR family, sensor histidine kinase CiaH
VSEHLTSSQTARYYKRARVRLTLFYIALSGLLLVISSGAALAAQRLALGRVERVLEQRAQVGEQQVVARLLGRRLEEFDIAFRQRLLSLNAVLLIIAGFGSYVLSGLSLKPFRENAERVEEFAADVSHELRTPLTTILMEIVAHQKTHKTIHQDEQQLYKNIQEEVERMRRIVIGLLALVRQDLPHLKHAVHKVNVVEVIHDVCTQLRPVAAQKKITLNCPDTSTSLYALIDQDHLKQVLLILVDNALKFNVPQGSVTLKAKKDHNMLLLEVNDTGVGIPEEELQYIFNRFWRAQKVSRHQQSGAGLGLTIAKKIIESYNGKIKVSSRLGEGTTFCLYLPI